MSMKSYFESLTGEERKQLAKRIGTSVAYLSQLAHEHRRASPTMAVAIQKATSGAVTVADIRPDLAGVFAA